MDATGRAIEQFSIRFIRTCPILNNVDKTMGHLGLHKIAVDNTANQFSANF